MYFFGNNSLGKERRMSRLISSNGRCLIVPVDDSLITGPIDGLFNLETKIRQMEDAKPNAILAFPGSATLCRNLEIPLIVNLTASTTQGQHTNKVLISSVEQAILLGADAVAVHMNVSSMYESQMLKNIQSVSDACSRFGIPLMVIVYPRGEKIIDGIAYDENYLNIKENDIDMYTKKVAHCVRVAFELGADIIKTQYTGSRDSFEKIIISAPNRPILIAGGAMKTEEILFEMIENSVLAGAAGVSIGRNVFNQKHSDKIIMSIKKMLFYNFSAKQALEYYLDLINTIK